jgi:hypothetical protein
MSAVEVLDFAQFVAIQMFKAIAQSEYGRHQLMPSSIEWKKG